MHIAICGNIGSGKTTLAKMLARHYGWQAELEAVEDNPYLVDFYKDMKRWSFHLQVYFLTSRFIQVKKIMANSNTTVQDRTIYEDAYIFAANLHKSGYMNSRDYATYLTLFQSMIEQVEPPRLLIYLKADIPKLESQIKKRARDYERGIRSAYLNNLNACYEAWISSYKLGKVLTIDVNNIDFVANPGDLTHVVNKINALLKTRG